MLNIHPNILCLVRKIAGTYNTLSQWQKNKWVDVVFWCCLCDKFRICCSTSLKEYNPNESSEMLYMRQNEDKNSSTSSGYVSSISKVNPQNENMGSRTDVDAARKNNLHLMT